MNPKNAPHEDDLNHVVADNVRAELSRQRWTGRKAAEALGLTPTYVSRRLSGETHLSPADLIMFARFLRVSVAYLVGETDDPRPLNDANGGPRRARTDDPRINGTSLWPDLYGDTDPTPVADLDFERERRRPILVEVSA